MTLRDLAHFTIRSIELINAETALVRGEFSHLDGVRLDDGERTVGFLFRSRQTSVYLYLSSPEHFNAESRSAAFTAYLTRPALRVGQSLPYVDYYWSPKQVAFGLETANWERTRFRAVDAVRYLDPKVPGYWTSHIASEPPSEGASDVRVLKKGWDHEHCNFCRTRIGKGGRRFGFYSKPDNDWLCDLCYKRFVARHDLRYLQFKT